HCSVFAGKCIKEGGLNTHLIPKTGTIVPEYKREYYLPVSSINASVIAIADFTRKYLIDTYELPADRVALVYQGTHVDQLRSTPEGRAEALRRYPLPANAAPVLGCVGSFEPRKGQSVLFDAVASLAQGPLPDVHLILAGDGPDEDMLREKIQAMEMQSHITLFPFTREPIYVFERIDITVVSSLYKEGLPNVLLESLAMNVPAVSTNLGGVPEAIIDGETGYIVDPGSSEQLADAILKLWEDQEAYLRMKSYVRQFVEEKFDKQVQFGRFLTYFESVL
ncbi:MAG: glycosyltransferase family 4 protein, partial [Anaerolineales bacterium]|nr:glycosyltransferase family 4 protein [Anaerolineales bacterium]